MNTIALNYEKADKIFDVIVIGGGTAGAFAAMAAAREGKDVLICERGYALGGSATLALTTPKMTNHMKNFVSNSSLNTELEEMLSADGCTYDNQWFNPQILKIYLERQCAKYNVNILYGMDFISVVVENETITEAVFNTASGLRAFSAKCFVDCSGDAMVAYQAGCPVECGKDGLNQPMSLRFAIGDVDVWKAKDFYCSLGCWNDQARPTFEIGFTWKYDNNFTKLVQKAVDEGVLLKKDANYIQVFASTATGEKTVWCNCPEAGHIRNAVRNESITEMILYSRQSAVRIHDFFKKYIPGFENSIIHSFADMPGIRESRRIIGDYLLSEDDFENRLKVDDCVAQTAYPIDIHDEHNLVLHRMNADEYYEIPYRCMLPKGVNNLLVAGRCISATFVAQASMRIQLVCMALGEAAGIAAAMNPNVRKNDGAVIREIMKKYGATFVDR